MKKKLLLRLADLLEKESMTKKIKFDMDKWGNVYPKQPMSCKTTACAMGLAALSGEFAKEGLGYVLGDNISKDNGDILFTMNNVLIEPDDSGNNGLVVAETLFGISDVKSTKLFVGPSYEDVKGPKGARREAWRIRQFVKTGIVPGWEETP